MTLTDPHRPTSILAPGVTKQDEEMFAFGFFQLFQNFLLQIGIDGSRETDGLDGVDDNLHVGFPAGFDEQSRSRVFDGLLLLIRFVVASRR